MKRKLRDTEGIFESMNENASNTGTAQVNGAGRVSTSKLRTLPVARLDAKSLKGIEHLSDCAKTLDAAHLLLGLSRGACAPCK